MNFFFLADEQRQIVAYLDSVQARLVAVREVQSATGEESFYLSFVERILQLIKNSMGELRYDKKS